MTRIIIEVRGGVAYVTAANSPEPVQVLLVDWDNIDSGEIRDDLLEWKPVKSTEAEFDKELKEIKDEVDLARAAIADRRPGEREN